MITHDLYWHYGPLLSDILLQAIHIIAGPPIIISILQHQEVQKLSTKL